MADEQKIEQAAREMCLAHYDGAPPFHNVTDAFLDPYRQMARVAWRLFQRGELESEMQDALADPDRKAPERCADCGATVDGDGISTDERACFYCKGD